MWFSLWGTVDRFSLPHFRHLINELQEIRIVENHNWDLVVDIVQSIVEIVTYGDRQDPQLFECFMEYQVLAEFVRVLRISTDSRIEVPLLQYLSILIQNMESEHGIYYCFSNGHINNIIAHPFNFGSGDVDTYYISFLRAVSSKVNIDTLCLLVKVHGDTVVSFPLYSEALKFSQHSERMIQTAVRAITLNLYKVSDDVVLQFLSIPPVSDYFSNLVWRLKEQCSHLDGLVHAIKERFTDQGWKELLLEADKIVDEMYYLKDVISVGESCLSQVVSLSLLNFLIFPILCPLLMTQQSDSSNLSVVTSLYVVSRIIQVVGSKEISHVVTGTILHPFLSTPSGNASGLGVNSTGSDFNDRSRQMFPGCQSGRLDNINGNLFHRYLSGNISHSDPVRWPVEDASIPERSGILPFVVSEDPCVTLASLFLLLTLAKSEGDEYCVASISEFCSSWQGMMSNALLKILMSESSMPASVQGYTGWFLHKLLMSQGKGLDDENLQLFKNSYDRACDLLEKELDGCWYDHVLPTLRGSRNSCTAALEESSLSKDPIFLLELAVCPQTKDVIYGVWTEMITGQFAGDSTSYAAWQRMVDIVKSFILHLQLKAFISRRKFLENPLPEDHTGSSLVEAGRTHVSNHQSASFGSDVSLGSGIPCRIALSNAGVRHIYLIPAAKGTSGNLLLAEKHPFRSERGIVIAILPLAGLNPKLDEDHPTWMHLTTRELEPSQDAAISRRCDNRDHVAAAGGRWTLGFQNVKACKAARSAILEETSKQRSAIRSVLAPLLQIK